MNQSKPINPFLLSDVDIHSIVGNESHIFTNNDIVMVINGNPQNAGFIRDGNIYHLVEPRVILALEGEADIRLNLEDCHIVKGTIVMTTTDVIVEIKSFTPDFKMTGIGFKNSRQINDNHVFYLSADELQRILRLIYLTWDFLQLTPYRKETISHLLDALVSEALYLEKPQGGTDDNKAYTRQQEQFIEFKKLVNKYCDHERSIPFYAAQMGITPHHLSAIIKKASGRSVMYWINCATIQKAKLLLKTTSLLAYEVADRLDFISDSSFSKFFKRETGMTPKQYQSQVL